MALSNPAALHGVPFYLNSTVFFYEKKKQKHHVNPLWYDTKNQHGATATIQKSPAKKKHGFI